MPKKKKTTAVSSREAVWADIWKSKRYQKIQELKDRLNRQVTMAEHYARSPSSSPAYTKQMVERCEALTARLKKVFAALRNFESKVFAKHGVKE